MVDNLSLNLFQNKLPRREIAMVSVPSPEINKELKQDNKKKLILPLSLIAGGGILLYYGIKAPTKSQIIKKIVKDRIGQMQSNLKVYTQTVDETISNSYQKIADYIDNYARTNTAGVSPNIFTKLTEPKKIINAQDLAYEAVVNTSLQEQRAADGSLTGIGKFSVEIGKVNKNVLTSLNRKKELMRLLFEDYTKLPANADEDLNKLIISSSAKLKDEAGSVLGQMEVDKFTKYKEAVAKYFEQMSQTITNSRNEQLNAKRQIIDAAFARISEILELGDDFVPTYRRLPELENYNKLTKQELKPVKVSDDLMEVYGNNHYFKEAISLDFNKINEKDIYRIFYSSPYENNLEDLKLLIDRLRLRQVVSQDSSAPEYKVVIAKLEYLVNKLHEFGVNEIVKKSSRDFAAMKPEQKRAALYYVSTVSRRMGFNTIADMDKYMAAYNSQYAKLNMRDFMELFQKNPELYFF